MVTLTSRATSTDSLSSPVLASIATQTHASFSKEVPPHRLVNSLHPCREEAWAQALIKKGFNSHASDLIVSRHRVSTKRQYQVGWSLFLKYVRLRNISKEDIRESTVANFLAYHAMVLKRAYNTVANYKCAISDPINVYYNIDTNNSRNIISLMKGLWELHPPQRGIMPKWDLSVVLEYLRSPTFEPLDHAKWDELIAKCAFLFQLGSGGRLCEIVNTTLNSSISADVVKFDWSRDFKAKYEGPKKRSDLPSVSALGDRDLLCPVRAFSIYYRRRAKLVSRRYGHRLWPYGLCRISFLIKRLIKNALKWKGKNYNIPIGPHQVRKLAVSLSWKYFRCSEMQLYKKVGSFSMKVPYKNYIRNVDNVKFSCVVPMGVLHPTAQIIRNDLPHI